jgi:hypothetical protein
MSAAGKEGGKARGGGSAIEGLREGRLGDVVIVDTGCKFTELSVFDIRGVGVVIWVEKESLGILKKEQRLFFTIFILGVVLVTSSTEVKYSPCIRPQSGLMSLE